MKPRPTRAFATLAAALLACAPVTATAQTARSGPPSPLLRGDTAVLRGRLPNGVTFYVRRNIEPARRAELRLVVNAGSTLEDPDQRGLAHVVEHMAFNGTRRFPKQALVDYLEGIGMRFGPDINAYTSHDETVYQLQVPTDRADALETGFRVLEDWAAGVTFDTAEVRRERGVVLEEWRLGRGAGARVWDRQSATLFGAGSRYAERNPIGTRASLESFDAAALRRFYRDWYRPDLIAVVVVGDVDPRAVEQRIRAGFAGLRGPANPRPRRRFPVPAHPTTRVAVAADAELPGWSVSLFRKRPIRVERTRADYRRGMVESLFGEMLYSRLHERTLVAGAALLGVGQSQGVLVRTAAADVLSADVRPGRTAAAVGEMAREIERVRRWGFTVGELARTRRESLRRWEQIAAERDKMPSSQFAAEYASHFLYGGPLLTADQHLALHRELLPRIGHAEVGAQARQWGSAANRVVLAAVPATDSLPAPTVASLRAALDAATRAPLPAYRETTSNRALLRRPPTPGRIVSERTIPEIGVREWRLSNGARVLLKPTDFRADEILFAGWSPGGLSLAPDSLLLAAQTATAAVQVSGVGDWDLLGLSKRLAGTAAGVGPYIDELGEGLSGSASTRDLRTLMELVHLYVTEPRADTSAWNGYRSRAKALFAEQDRSPEQAWGDTLQSVLTQAHPRARPLRAADFDRMSLDRSLQFYRDRFRDAGDWTFVLVGTVDPDSARPLVEQYLASLPATGRVERGRDVGIRPPTGVVTRVVRRGSEPKARTQFVWTGPFSGDRAEVRTMQMMAGVLELRLREVLREDLGGTYGAGVGASAAQEPTPQFRIAVGFGAAPDRLDELSRAMWTEIDSLRTHGPRASDLEKVREMTRRERELRVRENDWWIAQLLARVRNGGDPAELARLPDPAEITPEAVRAAAIRYLDPANHVQVSLVPESGP